MRTSNQQILFFTGKIEKSSTPNYRILNVYMNNFLFFSKICRTFSEGGVKEGKENRDWHLSGIHGGIDNWDNLQERHLPSYKRSLSMKISLHPFHRLIQNTIFEIQ